MLLLVRGTLTSFVGVQGALLGYDRRPMVDRDDYSLQAADYFGISNCGWTAKLPDIFGVLLCQLLEQYIVFTCPGWADRCVGAKS